MSTRRDPLYGPITAEQQRRMDACEAELAEKRKAAAFFPILETRRPAEGEVNCAGCNHLGDFNDEHRRGFCAWLRHACSTWHPVRCAAFIPLQRERQLKVSWKGVVYE